MSPENRMIVSLLDHVEKFLADSGAPLTDAQAAVLEAAREDQRQQVSS